MNAAFGIRWFEVRIEFSDGTTRSFDLPLKMLKRMGTGITTLNHTKKLRMWIMSDEGRRYFEEQVNL